MNLRPIGRFAALAGAAISVSQSGYAQTYAPTLYEYLDHDGRFGTFLSLVKSCGADSWLKTESTTGATVMAPTDQAFAKLPEKVMAALAHDRLEMGKVIEFHIVPREETAAQVRLGPKTVEGELLSLSGGVPRRTAHILSPDIQADNGKIQIVDQVLMPHEVMLALQRDGDMDIAVGLPISPRMTAAGLIQNVPISGNRGAKNAKRRSRGHWGRVPGRYGKVWIPGT